MEKIEKIYIITIERSKSFRSKNINTLKTQLKNMMANPCEIEETGVDCQRIYGNQNRIKELQKNGLFVKKWQYTILGRGRKFRPGEIGCFLSHYSVWEDMVKNNIQYALVFEDDSKINADEFKNELTNIIHNAPEFCYVSLYHSPQDGYIKRSTCINKYIKKATFDLWGTVSYLINLRCAKEFVQQLKPVYAPVDRVIANYCRKNDCLHFSVKNLVKLCDSRSIIR